MLTDLPTITRPTWCEDWVRTRKGKRAHLIISDLKLTPAPHLLLQAWGYGVDVDANMLQAVGSIDLPLNPCDVSDATIPAPLNMPRCIHCSNTLDWLDELVNDYRRAYIAQAIAPEIDRLRAHYGAIYDGGGE